jgi:hypothetical protein
MAAGLIVALATLFAASAISSESMAGRVLNAFVWHPETLIAERLTDCISPGNRDAGFVFGMFLHPAYCIVIGGLIGFAAAWLRRCVAARGKV